MQRPEMTRVETLEHMLNKAQRKVGAPVRREFVQAGTRYAPRPGPLAAFVHNRDQTALDLYLLALTLATRRPNDISYPAGWWRRALGLSADTLVSRAWTRLEQRQLIKRRRQGRNLIVRVLKDDGSGKEYERPATMYGNLPLDYWRDGHCVELDLAAKATLLIALCQAPGGFSLPAERAPDWYGISADTVESGLRTLRQRQIITREQTWRVDRRSGSGYSNVYVYKLLAPFTATKARTQRGGTHLEVLG